MYDCLTKELNLAKEQNNSNTVNSNTKESAKNTAEFFENIFKLIFGKYAANKSATAPITKLTNGIIIFLLDT